MSRLSSSNVADHGSEPDRRNVRRNAVLLALVAVAVFVAFITATVLRSGAVS